MIIVQRRRLGGLKLPIDSEIMWYGTAANVPAGWSLDTTTYNAFIMGCALGSQTTTITGSASHVHTVPTTGTEASHNHPVTASWSGTTGNYRGPGADDGVHLNVAQLAHAHSASGSTNSRGAHSHTNSNTGSGTIYPPYNRVYWIRATEEAEFPINGIMMFNDVLANLTPEFVLCNGSNSTPDLRAKFIYGAAQDSHVNTTGGTTTHTHTNSSTGSAGTHSHTISGSLGASSGHVGVSSANNYAFASHGHTHTASMTSNADPNHTHTLGNTGSGTHTPPYIRLFYVMRAS